MENIILTNNKDLRLVGVKVGVLSTLRFELPLVSASATHVEVIVTSGGVHSAYTATFIDATKRWQCDIAASQFPTVGKQSYEVAYVLDGKQFWDGKGWIEIEDATTSGIEPQPRPEPYRYAVVSVNGYGADAQGAVRIPKTFISANSPVTTEGYIEGDIYFNSETGATWTLCNVQSTLTWVFNYKNYYTKEETDEAIDRVAAYYITYDAAGNPFPTYAALANATTVYSGGEVRVPTRNDYCVVLADETHDNAEYRYIYAVAEGEATGSWQPQFPVEGVMTVDQTVTKNSANPVSGGGVWSAIWGALAALPTGFASLYDWCVAQFNAVAANFTSLRSIVDGKVDTSGGTMTGNLTFSSNGDLGVAFHDVIATARFLAWWDNPDDGLVFNFFGGTDGTKLVQLFCSQPGRVALAAPNPAAGHLAALDANGNPVDAGIAAGDLARYALVTPTISSGAATLSDRACNAVTAAATLTLPAAVSGHARDLIVDVDNSAGASDIGLELASDAAAYLDAGGARYLVAVADGDDLADLLTVAAGERARLYFTETAQTATPTGGTSAVPVISVQRLTVTVGGAS